MKLHRRSSWLVIAWVLLPWLGLTAGCGDDGDQPATVRLFDSDNGASPRLEVGDSLVVSLESNPSTGFSWMVEISSPRLTLREQRFEPPQTTAEQIGVPGTQVFEFAAVSVGSGPPLQLAYKRSTGEREKLWEVTPIVRRSS